MLQERLGVRWVLLLGLLGAAGCDDGGGGGAGADARAPDGGAADVAPADAAAPVDAGPVDAGDAAPARLPPLVPAPDAYAEIEALGITRFFGRAQPIAETEAEGGITSFTFDPADGPVCFRGEPFSMAVRDRGHGDLLIFLQGGGACWSDFCFAIDFAREGMPPIDILDPALEANPVRDWDVAYLPYCDGSLFVGEAAYDDDDDGEIDRQHAGLRNVSAALDVIAARFPAPRRILLAGSSGGAYGTILTTVLVRAKYPTTPLYVFSDSGVGVAKAAEPTFLADLLVEFDAAQYLPASCTDCITNGHLTRLIAWQLERDTNLRLAQFSSVNDFVIANLFLMIGPAGFEPALLEETAWLAERFPDRYRRFIVPGKLHTTLLGDASGFVGPELGERLAGVVELGNMTDTGADGVTVGAWLEAMLADDPVVWREIVVTE